MTEQSLVSGDEAEGRQDAMRELRKVGGWSQGPDLRESGRRGLVKTRLGPGAASLILRVTVSGPGPGAEAGLIYSGQVECSIESL